MNYSKDTSLTTRSLRIVPIVLVAAAIMLTAGCWTKRVDGTKTENQRPEVWFSNVPAEGAKTSVNPIIYWVGQDKDGQVVTFRYIVIREADIAAAVSATVPVDSQDVQQYVNTVLATTSDTMWTYLTVNPLEGQPQTTNIIPMQAEISNPVLQYVPQYVFVQAFDDLNASSSIVFRKFLRNDNPPDTRMVGFVADPDRPFINAPRSGGITTGIRLRWEGDDRIDYPTEPPPFEFEWRMYGPYTDSVYNLITSNFVKSVFVTNDARVFVFGRNEWIKRCDTIPNGTGGFDIECDSTFVDNITASGPLGTLDTSLLVDDSGFTNNPSFNKIVDSSFDGDTWVSDVKDSLFDVFRTEPSPETQQAKFIFWVRSRDDAKVPDLTPTFVAMDVVNPKYEREVLVVWMNSAYTINPARMGSARHYWWSAVRTWQEAAGLPLAFDSAVDFVNPDKPTGTLLPLKDLLSHKIVVFYGDDVQPGIFKAVSVQTKLFTAIDAGVNVWMCTRAPYLGGEDKPGQFEEPMPLNYRVYFGVQALTYSGWEWYCNGQHVDPPLRIEDFEGTYSLDPTKWPDLKIDTSKLHSLYVWNYDWDPSIACLPEVNWCVRTFDTEAMYLYKSRYGASHPLGEMYSFNGRPVAHRLNRGYFRTAHSLFTPLAINDSTGAATQWVNSVFDYLYAPFKTATALATGSQDRQPNGNALLSEDQYRANYWERRQEGWDPEGRIRYYYGQPVTPEVKK